ncbi:hypothetical protein DSL92_03820 [Billgrantia gudaonensis]|uniref:Uncharacterized protein n=1 Tax=Billgrantia gudaonensis TaxID=376427 RepID=A0A432JJI7_9GAMM|nr:hypothetical protein DSL92_03820 [Halomonas gudaonensis]
MTFMADPAQPQSQPDNSTTSDRAGHRATPGAASVVVAAGCVGGLLSHLPLPMAGTAALVVFASACGNGRRARILAGTRVLLIAILFQLAPPRRCSATSTFWLFFGGIVLGIAIRHTGLGQRIAQLLSSRLGNTYAGMIVSHTGGAGTGLHHPFPRCPHLPAATADHGDGRQPRLSTRLEWQNGDADCRRVRHLGPAFSILLQCAQHDPVRHGGEPLRSAVLVMATRLRGAPCSAC